MLFSKFRKVEYSGEGYLRACKRLRQQKYKFISLLSKPRPLEVCPEYHPNLYATFGRSNIKYQTNLDLI